ncbi:MAG: aromatic ring-hydroxylating dioxygenase subunit alpha [Acidobacteriota bacterium]|nr:aromatic ring-hydroxylating dioxygenase subunit alpha [Acidobacteriota bacterium]
MKDLRKELAAEIAVFDPGRPIEDNYTPPASWYNDPQFHMLERETVFKDHWLVAGRADQAAQPRQYFTGSYLGRPFLVVRGEDEVLRAFYNVCSHHGTCVAAGEGETDQLVCPYHGWTYALDGQLRKAPRAGRIQDLAGKNPGLQSLLVQVRGPFVWICFAEESAPDLDTVFGQWDGERDKMRWDDVQFVKRVSYTIDCNWKVYVDNYLDGGYHVPHMHQDLSGGLDIGNYRSQIGDVYSIQSCPAAKSSDRLGDQAHYAWIYPNFMVNRYGPWMDTNLVLPLDTGRCLTIFDYYHEGPVADEVLAAALAESDQVQQEDIHVCGLVQTGLQSGAYHRGIYAPRFEKPMYHFHRLLARDLRGDVS